MNYRSTTTHASQSWSTRVDRRLRVAVPPGAGTWRVGQRVYWLFNANRPGTVVVSDGPRGTLQAGRYFTTVVQRARLRRHKQSSANRIKTRSLLSVSGMLIPAAGLSLSIEEMKL